MEHSGSHGEDDEAMGSIEEHKFRLVFEAMTQGALLLDSDWVIRHANPAAERILGLPKSYLVGRSGSDTTFQKSDAKEQPFATSENPGRRALERGEAECGAIVSIFNPQLQQRRLLSVDYLPLQFGVDGETALVCSIFTDVTEQHRVQNALRHSQSHLAAAQRIASVGSVFYDFTSDTMELSDQFYAIFGLDKESFSPSIDSVLGRIHPDDRSHWLDAIESARGGTKPDPFEYRVERPDGQIRILYRESELIRDADGGVTGALATIHDVTELRESEREKAELQNQLYHAQRLEALGTLAGGIAHDLNNTLVPILGLSEALLSALEPQSRNRGLIEIIHQAGVRARDLVRQVLAFSRREHSESRPLRLSPFMQDTMRLIRASAPSSITIKQFFADVPPVIADSSQLHQVVVNLFTNAIQAIGDTEGTISVRLSECTDRVIDNNSSSRKKFARISVIDSGCGMSEETQQRIFEPFFTTRNVGQGTGLGL